MPGSGLSLLSIVAWGLVALGGLVLLFLLGRALLAVWRRVQPLNVWARYAEESSPFRRRRNWGWLGTLLLLLLSLLLIGAGWGLFRLEMAGRVYRPFVPDQVAARMQCVTETVEAAGPLTCALTLSDAAAPYTVSVVGVRWEIEAETLVWDPVLEGLGLRSGYRLLHLVGYDSANRAIANADLPPTSEGLGFFFGWLDGRFPFVQARREIVSGEVSAGMLYELTATRAGFSLRKWEPVQP